jgi:hypothetical protein
MSIIHTDHGHEHAIVARPEPVAPGSGDVPPMAGLEAFLTARHSATVDTLPALQCVEKSLAVRSRMRRALF